jgi:hypothetical protein
MAGSRKKVIVRLERGVDSPTLLTGYLPASGLLDAAGTGLEVLDTAGRLTTVPLKNVRYVAYVRDFNLDDTVNPERLLRKTFLARPRTEGLWVRLTFRDGEVLEGLGELDLAIIDDAAMDRGIFLIPPDVRSNTQRIYVPRLALNGMQVVGVITTPSKAESPKKIKKADERGSLFPIE